MSQGARVVRERTDRRGRSCPSSPVPAVESSGDPGGPTDPIAAGAGPGAGVSAATWVLVIGVTLGLGWLVAAREGNLAWDDADYLRDGLRVANMIRSAGLGRPDYALDVLLDVRPKPPWLVAWIAGGSLVTGVRSPVALILFASVVPFAILLIGVAATSRALFGRRAAGFATLVAVASPMALSFGAKVMVETFLSLWVLLAYYCAARLFDRPAKRPALALGAVLGCALLTKLTAALLLPIPALGFLAVFCRRHGAGREAGRMLARVVGPLLLVALPWYAMNGRAAAEFARFSSRYNLVALGESGGLPRSSRPLLLASELAGVPLLATLAVAGCAAVAGRRGRAVGGGSVAARMFVGLSVVGAASGAVILLYPPYFDPRFLLPVWPALAVCLGPVLRDATARRSRPGALATFALLAASLFASADRVGREERSRTFWGVPGLIDHLVADHLVANIYNVGSCRDWNVSKTGLMNELRDRPGDCFVLHDLSGGTPDEIVRRLARADAVVALDRGRVPAGWFGYGPKLNRGYFDAVIYLGMSPEFRRVESFPPDGLPPLLVFVRDRK